MRAFGIFEGGGAKGLAHVGALRACEDHGIEFCGVAGASAGSIVAALVAAGYTADELFDPEQPAGHRALLAAPMHRLIKGRIPWAEFKEVADDLLELSRSSWPKVSAAWLWLKHRRIRTLLAEHKGLFDPQSFAAWLDVRLESKLLANNRSHFVSRGFGAQRRPAERYRVRFEDLPLPLKIVATDLSGGRVVEFSQASTPNVPVAQAVAASIAIPLFFEPLVIEASGGVFSAVDGGVISNFPAWLFDKERDRAGPGVPTLGFKLIVQAESPVGNLAAGTLLAYLKRLLSVAITGDPILETRQIDNLREVPLRVEASSLDFDMSPERKVALYDQGLTSARVAFGTSGFPVEAWRVEGKLQALVETFKRAVGQPGALVRACVICPTTRQTLRVTYRYAMDTSLDTDDQLELGLHVGASGRCYQLGVPVRADMRAASATYEADWSMTKYQQALVRQDIKTLICMPIISESGKILGVVSMDSPDEAMLEAFGSGQADAFLWSTAQTLAQVLDSGAVAETR